MSEVLRTTLLDVEELQQLSYERSRKWALYLGSICETQDDPIDIHELDELYEDNPEDQDELASMEDEASDGETKDSQVLKDLTNLVACPNRYSNTTDTTIIQDDANKMVDLFNQTLPVINEHNRQLKDLGFDRILNTFNAKTIEEKVGGWLKKHNSLCIPNNSNTEVKESQYETPNRVLHQVIPSHIKSSRLYDKYRNDDSDSDSSFHSGETARYIRSSRVGAIKNSSSPTTMIKTYRTVKSSRLALKEKYAFAQDDDAELHLKKLRHRRRIFWEVENQHLARAHKHRLHHKTPSRSLRKRKILRKRSASNSCSAKDTTDSDSSQCTATSDRYNYRKYKCCGQHKPTVGVHAMNLVKRSHRGYIKKSSSVCASVKRSQYRAAGDNFCVRKCHPYYADSETYSVSPSSSPSMAISPSCSYVCKTKFESKCHCCQGNKESQEYQHSFNSSTTYITKKIHIETHLEEVQDKFLSSNAFPMGQISAVSDNALSINEEKKEVSTSPKNVPKKKRTKAEEEILDSTFETELKLALKESKELYEKEKKAMQTQAEKTKTTKKRQILPSVPLKKNMPNNLSSPGKQHLKRYLSEDHPTVHNLVQQKSWKTGDSSDELTVLMKPSTSAIALSTHTCGGSEETFFSASNRVCNSTALPNDKSACKRQIEVATTINKRQNEKTLDNTEDCEDEEHKQDKKLNKLSRSEEMVNGKSRELINTKNNCDDVLVTPREKNKALTNNISKNKEAIKKDHKKSVKTKVPLRKILKSTKKGSESPFLEDEEDAKKHTGEQNKTMKNSIKRSDSEEMNANNSVKINYSIDTTEVPRPRRTPVHKNKSNQNLKNDDDQQSESSHRRQLEKKTNNRSIASDIRNHNEVEDTDIQLNEAENETETRKTVSKNNKSIYNVISSTTKHSPDISRHSRQTRKNYWRRTSDDSSVSDANDCTVVSSTTSVEPQATKTLSQQHGNDSAVQNNTSIRHHPRKGILIYTPNHSSKSVSISNDNCFFHISKEHLTSVIGEKPAEKFLKYYIGRRRFNKNSSVYFKPPAARVLDTNYVSSSDSDVDDLERMGKYGDLYESDGSTSVADVPIDND